jgi:transposase
MIQLTPQMKIMVAIEPVDFRKGIDGLAGICRTVIASDPFGGQVFVFRNKRQTAIKILLYDGQGFWLFQKRLSRGRFTWWPEREGSAVERLAAHELQLLLWNGDPRFSRVAAQWRKLVHE